MIFAGRGVVLSTVSRLACKQAAEQVCGLMVALVVAWNVDLGKFTQVQMDQEIRQDDIEQITEQLYGEGNAFVEKGTVYQDPVTGKYYLVEDESSSSSAGGSGQNGSPSENG